MQENPDVVLNIVDASPLFVWLWNFILNLFPIILNFLGSIFNIIVAVAFPVSLIFFIGIIYSVEMLKRIRAKEAEIFDLKVQPAFDEVDKGDPGLALRFESVMRHIESDNQNDWKQAIMEADIILDEILTKIGYRGESVGEKLKRVEPSDFDTLQDAWDAHKIRNLIAHEGSSYSISQHEARRVINQYKKVFEEFYYI